MYDAKVLMETPRERIKNLLDELGLDGAFQGERRDGFQRPSLFQHSITSEAVPEAVTKT